MSDLLNQKLGRRRLGDKTLNVIALSSPYPGLGVPMGAHLIGLQ